MYVCMYVCMCVDIDSARTLEVKPYLSRSRSGRDRQVETCQLPALQAEKAVVAGGLHAATSSAVPRAMLINLGTLLM